MAKRILVLGAGLIGAEIAADLSTEAEFEISIADVSELALEKVTQKHAGKISVIRSDLGDLPELQALARQFDLVCGALPSRLGFAALRAVLEVGRPYCDISFMSEDPTSLNSLAQMNATTAVVDCGVAPGLSHMIAGQMDASLDHCDRLKILVGGVPAARYKPFEYKAPFAPSDVLEEYTRPSRVVEDGVILEKPALSEVECLDFPGVGTLEAFITDGLRSLVRTLTIPNMVEKTMRWPGHAELMSTFQRVGFFSSTPLEVRGNRVVPRDVLEALLFPLWKYEDQEQDLTVLRVVAQGLKDHRPVQWVWNLLDRAQGGVSSMARTTAYPCAIMARMILEGSFTTPGVHPPEIPGADPGVFREMVDELNRRGVALNDQILEVDGT